MLLSQADGASVQNELAALRLDAQAGADPAPQRQDALDGVAAAERGVAADGLSPDPASRLIDVDESSAPREVA